MFKRILWLGILLLSFEAFADSDTLIFKLRNRIDGYPNDKKSFEFRVEENGLTINVDLQGESYDNTWLWQTYNFAKADSAEVVSPKLPAGCKPEYSMTSYVEGTKADFHMVFGFVGKSCIALRELLTKEKFKILYKNVPVYDENRKKDKLYMLIDDLHHSHMTNLDAFKLFENYVNSTTHKTMGTFVAFNNFELPKKFDECQEVPSRDSSAGDLLGLTMDARDLKTSDPTGVAFIHAAGEVAERLEVIIDPTGMGKFKRCTLNTQYLNPAPRNGLLKNARSIFYFSLTNDFKMLMQSNAKN